MIAFILIAGAIMNYKRIVDISTISDGMKNLGDKGRQPLSDDSREKQVTIRKTPTSPSISFSITLPSERLPSLFVLLGDTAEPRVITGTPKVKPSK